MQSWIVVRFDVSLLQYCFIKPKEMSVTCVRVFILIHVCCVFIYWNSGTEEKGCQNQANNATFIEIITGIMVTK